MPRSREDFYKNARLYDAMHRDYAVDLEFYLEEGRRAKGAILELACGSGRLSLALAAKGFELQGLERENSMLKLAREKAKALGLKLPFVRGDMRSYRLGKKFKLIFVAFNSLLHLHDLEDYEAFFATARRHLLPQGRLLIDVFNPKVEILAGGQERQRVLDFVEPDSGEAAWVEEARYYDAAHQLNCSTWYGSTISRADAWIQDLKLRCLYPQELRGMLKHAGFHIEKAYGNYAREPFVSASPRQVLRLKAS